MKNLIIVAIFVCLCSCVVTQEQSVKPGINEKYLDPDLQVDIWVKRFEVESREIYVARNEIVDAVALKKGEQIADIGAGTGLFVPLFAKKVGEHGWTFAVDIVPKFLEHIREQAEKDKNPNISPVLCSENSINLPSNSIDVAFICDTYHHFEYPKSSMGSIYKALRPGGRLVIIDFERIPGKTQQWILDHVRAGKEVFRKEIEEVGFRFVEEKKLTGLQENYFLCFEKVK